MRRVLVLLGCLLAGGCSFTEPSESDERAAPLIAYSRSGRIWVARLDGSGERVLARGGSPAISPNGRWVAYRDPGYRELMLVSAAGGRPRLLVRAAGAPAWSPDSRRLAAIQNLDERNRALLSIDVETGESTTVARGAIDQASFSPDGDEIAYARGHVFGKVDVYTADAGGGGERRVTNDGSSAYPVWGPRDIAFARIVPYRGWGAHEIWLVRPDGTQRRLLTKTPRPLLGSGIVGLVPVAWSANGRALLAALANEFGGVPYSVDPQTGSVRPIGAYDYHAWPNGLSRDGRFVLVSETSVGLPDRTRTEVVPYAGGDGRVVASGAGEASWNR